MQLVKFKRGDRPWYKGRTQVELYGMRYVDGEVVWYCRALGGASSRAVPQRDLTEKADPSVDELAY